MSKIISIEIQTVGGSAKIAGTPFFIEGEKDQFAVHRTKAPLGKGDTWTVTHVDTGFAVCFAPTMKQVKEDAKAIWNFLSKERREKALSSAMKLKNERNAVKSEGDCP